MKAATLVLAPFLLAGCLAGDADTRACDAWLTPGDVPAGAPSEGGHGPRLIGVQLALGDGAPLIAWWAGPDSTAEFVALRASTTGAVLTVHAPDDTQVGVLAGLSTPASGDGRWTMALKVPAGRDPVDLLLTETAAGRLTGTWTTPASLGFGPQGAAWQSQALPLAQADAARLVSLRLDLAWENGPGGGADFGIGVASGPSTFDYRNGAYQTTPGPQAETRVLSGGALQDLAWGNGTPPLVGPSLSTGAFATQGIAYTLDWQAMFQAPPPSTGQVCDELGPVREVDVT